MILGPEGHRVDWRAADFMRRPRRLIEAWREQRYAEVPVTEGWHRESMKLTVQHADGMRFLATANGHTVVVDAAPEDGGGGTAMSAPQLFVAVMGACILEFVLNSCRLRGVPVEGLTVEMVYKEAPRPRRVGGLDATIRLEPDPPEAVKRRLIGVARHATLVNTLVQPPEMRLCFEGDDGK
jgi:uncharacterized OsmC-like protein